MEEKNCYFRESFITNGIRKIELENKYLIVTILPDKGADIYSIQYKPKGNVDVLWKSPWSLKQPGTYNHPGSAEEQWMDYYPGGWQTMFPNAGNACTYKGAYQCYHGEASISPWEYQVEAWNEELISVVFQLKLSRTPFQINKKVTLKSDQSELHIHEQVINRGEEDMDYIWGQHIAFGAPFLDDSCKLQVSKAMIRSDNNSGGSNSRLFPGATSEWPNAKSASGETIDFSLIPFKTIRSVDMAFITPLKAGEYVLSNESIGLSVGVSWDLAIFPYIWMWQELRGSFGYPFFGQCYVMGLEPCSVPNGEGLTESVQQGHSFLLKPGEMREMELCIKLHIILILYISG
jgi:galactose mutarotase-like enzyme